MITLRLKALTYAVGIIEYVYKERFLGYTQCPTKPELKPAENRFMHALLAYIKNMDIAGMKWAILITTTTQRTLICLSLWVL